MGRFTEKLSLKHEGIAHLTINISPISNNQANTCIKLVNRILDQIIEPVFDDLIEIYIKYKYKRSDTTYHSIMKDINKGDIYDLMKDFLIKNNSFLENMSKKLYVISLNISLFIVMLEYEQHMKDEFNKIMRDVI